MSNDILLYTDGSSLGNPGPGGWGVVLLWREYRKEISGGAKMTTNNRMELTAVIEGLKAIKNKELTVHVYSDSSYIVKAVNEGWLVSWIRNDFKNKKNEDLWREYISVSVSFKRLVFHWVKGHAGNPENERCDTLAVEQSKLYSAMQF